MISAVDRNQPTILFLHEGLGSIAQWRDFPDGACSGTGCPGIVYNRAGYGGSAPADLPRTIDFMHREARFVLAELLRKLKLQDVILVGHSDGGSIALIYASDPTVNVRGLVLIAPHVFVEEITVQSIARARTEYLRGNLKDRFQKYHQDADHTFLSWSDIWLNPEFKNWDIRPLLKTIKTPILVIQGEQDEFGTTAQVEAIQEECSVPVTSVMIPNCGHRPHIEAPTETLTHTIRFVKAGTELLNRPGF